MSKHTSNTPAATFTCDRAWRRRFAGVASSVKAGRCWLETVAAEMGAPDEQQATAALLLSETATNALRHTASAEQGYTVEVWARFAGWLRVEVRDAGSSSRPRVQARQAAPKRESGYGLALVEAFAHTWGGLAPEQGSGVFFEIAWQPVAPHPPAPLDMPGM
ncbi:ATP-binding protein [Salinactinospora qingdaonensis]|uniref:Histidine kinase/HSP90-like ATPase domain-containing protein n=1 Tax=Salinactinospora qingdaonensis TaxID=702744 RepID=A0ABP7FGT8_9ACTN